MSDPVLFALALTAASVGGLLAMGAGVLLRVWGVWQEEEP